MQAVAIMPDLRGAAGDDASVYTYDGDDLQSYFHLPQKEAAVKLGMCLSSLQNKFRLLGLGRWPARKLQVNAHACNTDARAHTHTHTHMEPIHTHTNPYTRTQTHGRLAPQSLRLQFQGFIP
jgi:hypothetical protein